MSSRPRSSGEPVRWVPVSKLSPLAYALLGESSADDVPRHVADRVTKLAKVWAEHGFTHETVRPWKDLPPAIADQLSARGVNPASLDLEVTIPPADEPTTLRRALAADLLSAEDACEQLDAAKASAQAAARTDAEPAASTNGHPVTPSLFSHPVNELPQSQQGDRPKPSRTPFSA
jgi:hypothetical protein